MGKQTPGASASQQIENGIDDFTKAMKPGTPMHARGWQKRSDATWSCIAHID